MIILHGGYLVPSPGAPAHGVYVWGEGAFVPRPDRLAHPRAISSAELEQLLGISRARPGRIVLTLPAAHGRPVPSMAALRDEADYTPGAFPLRPFSVDVLFLPPARSIDFLLHLPDHLRDGHGGAVAGDDLDYWVDAAGWAFQFLLRRRIVPSVADGQPRWRTVLVERGDRETLEQLTGAMPLSSRTASSGSDGGSPLLFPAPASILEAFLEETVDATARDLIRETLPVERRRAGAGPQALLAAAWGTPPGEAGDGPAWPAELIQAVARWSAPLLEPASERDLRLGIRLVPPDAVREGPGEWRLQFHLEEADDPTMQLSAADVWSLGAPDPGRGGPLSTGLEEILLRRLGEAAPLSPPIARSLEDRHPEDVTLTPDEVGRYLDREASALSDAGARILLPGNGRSAKVSVRLSARESSWRPGSTVTRFGLSTLVDFDWEVAIGPTRLTAEEFEELAARKIPLVAVRGEWVLLDPESVARVRTLLDRRPAGHTTIGDFLRIAGGLDAAEGQIVTVDAVSGEGWLRDFLDPEEARHAVSAFQAPASLSGTLRPYQARGVAWLRFLLGRGFGACLADDMGLGKTIQFLTTLLSTREAGEEIRPSLLICPTSVAENWQQEAARFAPSLKVAVHHGPMRHGGEAFLEMARSVDLVVTTYALAHRDRAVLSRLSWEFLALDEAQNVKNPATAQARAVRAFTARRRAALTGTPVENRLTELKAIFDFLNPGLLGSEESFRRDFAVPIERTHSSAAADRLRRITAPFLLRRLKTDPTIEPDLPEKIETREMVGLTREQATLYRATSRALLERIGAARGAARRAHVLVLLLRLKQLCDHPALLLADGNISAARSAKVTRLLEMLEETWAERRPALLFTQFSSMGEILAKSLRERFGTEVLFLHGGVPRKARAEMVRRFQEEDDPPLFFVLSLKAGGSGLNLTQASHVFHVDRWWNPAVEDQATDRVFRIGQTRHVQVHKFVCRGTLEERIDAMIEEKKALARTIVGAGESWITAMSDGELAELVRLDRDVVDPSEGVR